MERAHSGNGVRFFFVCTFSLYAFSLYAHEKLERFDCIFDLYDLFEVILHATFEVRAPVK